MNSKEYYFLVKICIVLFYKTIIIISVIIIIIIIQSLYFTFNYYCLIHIKHFINPVYKWQSGPTKQH